MSITHSDSCLQAALRQSSTSKISMQALDELKLFVGGLPWAMESEELKQVGIIYCALECKIYWSSLSIFLICFWWQAFSEFGAVQDANIVYDRETGRSRGFGFVTFVDKAHAEAACNQMNQAVSSQSLPAVYVCCVSRAAALSGVSSERRV